MMRLMLAPPQLQSQVLGVCVLRGRGDLLHFSMPAHALAVDAVVLRGRLWPLAMPTRLFAVGDLFATGSATHAQSFAGSADLVAASLLCRASVLPALHGEAAHVFCDAAAPSVLLADLNLDGWVGRAADATDAAIAGALLNAARRPLRAARFRSSAARFARALVQWNLRGADASPVGWSERTWQRACQAELGLSPMRLRRLARLHASVRARDAQPAQPWVAHALEAGYCDQAHLAREYRALAGVTPGGSTAPAGLGLRLGAGWLAPRFFAV